MVSSFRWKCPDSDMADSRNESRIGVVVCGRGLRDGRGDDRRLERGQRGDRGDVPVDVRIRDDAARPLYLVCVSTPVDPSWLPSAVAHSTAALVGIIGGLLVERLRFVTGAHDDLQGWGVDRAGHGLDRGSVMTRPLYWGRALGTSGQADHLYTGQGAEGRNSFGYGDLRK